VLHRIGNLDLVEKRMRKGKAAVTDVSNLAASSFSFAMEVASLTVMDKVAAAVTKIIAPLGITAAASGVVSGPKAPRGILFTSATGLPNGSNCIWRKIFCSPIRFRAGLEIQASQ
jgi:hypothetical protein